MWWQRVRLNVAREKDTSASSRWILADKETRSREERHVPFCLLFVQHIKYSP